LSSSLCPHGRRAFAVLALTLVGPLGGLAGAGPARAATQSTASSTAAQRPDLAASFVSQINRARGAAGRPQLAASSALTAVAAGWAAQMARANVLAHNPRLATSVSDWQFFGENVGVGYSVASLEGAFWASPEHRANMLDRDYSRLAVAVVDVGGKLWVVEDYELPMRAKPASPASRPQHQATRPTATRTVTRGKTKTHVGTPAAARPDALTQECAAQAMRLYAVRRTRAQGASWTVLRRSLIDWRQADRPNQTR
jgi:Cysteine-rich secretory protein family